MIRTLLALTLSLSLTLGCDANLEGADHGDADASETVDGGPDAGAGDASLADGGSAERSIETSGLGTNGRAAEVAGEDSALDAFSCYNGVADTEGAAIDCANPGCLSNASCCVGSSDSTCCEQRASSLSVLPSECSDLASCASDWTVFGASYIRGRTLRFGGDADADAGLVTESPIDVASGRVDATIEFVHASGCDESCLETITLALVEGAPGADEVLRPAFALSYSGARGEVTVLLDGARWASIPVEGASSTFTLALTPDGSATVSGAGQELTIPSAFSPGQHHLALYGRSRDATADGAAQVSALTLTVGRCDIPSAWATRASIPLTGTSVAAHHPRAVWTESGDVALAYATDSAVELRLGDDFVLLGPATTIPDTANVSDLALLADGDVLQLVTLEDGNLVTRSSDTSVGFADSTSSELLNFGGAATSFTITRTLNGVSAPRGALIALVGGVPRAYYENSGSYSEFTPDVSDGDAASLAEVLGGLEPSALSLTIYEGAWQLLATVRVGARTETQLFASDDLVHWRDVGTSLAPSGGDGFDSLTVSEASLVPEPDGNLAVVYRGGNGQTETLGYARRYTSSELD